MATFEQNLCEKLGITERQREQNAHISALFQNSVAALSVGEDFYMEGEETNTAKLRVWGSVYRLTLHLIAKGDFNGVIEMYDTKEYPCDPSPIIVNQAWNHISQFFKLVYTVWLTEQDSKRIVPVAKFLDRVKVPDVPYYTNWIRSDSEEKAYNAALETVTSMLSVLPETDFMNVCTFVKDPANIKDTQEARAVAWLCKKYEEAHRARYDEIQHSFMLAGRIIDAL